MSDETATDAPHLHALPPTTPAQDAWAPKPPGEVMDALSAPVTLPANVYHEALAAAYGRKEKLVSEHARQIIVAMKGTRS